MSVPLIAELKRRRVFRALVGYAIDLSVRQIGEELAVATVLEGSVRREGNALRLTAQLINAARTDTTCGPRRTTEN